MLEASSRHQAVYPAFASSCRSGQCCLPTWLLQAPEAADSGCCPLHELFFAQINSAQFNFTELFFSCLTPKAVLSLKVSLLSFLRDYADIVGSAGSVARWSDFKCWLQNLPAMKHLARVFKLFITITVEIIIVPTSVHGAD